MQIINIGPGPVDLAGWELLDVTDGGPTFGFPSLILGPGNRLRVYTNEDHPEWASLSFGSTKPIWNNSAPDTAALINAGNTQITTASYPPGC